MTPAQAAFVRAFDALCAEHSLGFDAALEVLADAVEDDRQRHADDYLIGSLLESARDDLRAAAFAIYASYK